MGNRTRELLVWPVAAFFVVIAFGTGLIAEAAFGDRASVELAAGSGEGAPSNASTNAATVELGDLFIEPAAISLLPGDGTITVQNNGKTQHDFTVPGLGATAMLDPGAKETLTLKGLEPGSYDFICSVPGHADGGMKGVITVATGDGEAADEASEDHSEHASLSPQAMLEADAARTGEFPQKTKGTGGRELEPTIASDGTKVFELTADETQWEVEKGVVKEGFAYNGQIPGPTLKAQLGDRVRIVLKNELDEQPTTLHLHGMILPNAMDGVPGIAQKAILPGKSFNYEFTVRNSGSNMYHSHFMADEQVPKGLLGGFIIEDPKDAKVDVDHTMVLNDGPLGFTINGKSFPATAPIVAAKGDLVRIRYMNEGLQVHPMHLHGIPQKVISKDGHLLKQPYFADTVLVGPGERYDVLVKADYAGVWAFHCHILTHAESTDGMFGMVTAMVVE
jgi:manganese oxidase